MPDQPGLVAHHRWLSLHRGFNDEPYVVSSPGVFIVPVDEHENVLFIREPAIATGKSVLTLPGGGVDGDEDHAAAANRELQEEIGFKAQRLDYLGEISPETRHTMWIVHTYLARDLVESTLKGDEIYEILVERIPLKDFESLIQSKQLNDGLIIAALYMARSLIAKLRT
jgi:ADP-ribose diphosphatase